MGMSGVNLSSTIRNNLQRVNERIERASNAVGRDPDNVRLVVVSKGHTVDKVEAAIAAGAKSLGENYLEEAIPKIQALSAYSGLEWHMIGHIQSRKARPVSKNFLWIHSLDSLKLATRLDRFAGELGCRLSVLLECNVSGEESKFGFPAWNPSHWDKLLDDVNPILSMSNINLRGLMTMAPFFQNPEEARPYYQRLRSLQDSLRVQFPQVDWAELSMGMSADFEVAIQVGATIVRVGQAILGPRPK